MKEKEGTLPLERRIRMYEAREAMLNRINPEVCDVVDLDMFLQATVEELAKTMEVERCDLVVCRDRESLRVDYEFRADPSCPSSLHLTLPLTAGALTELCGRDADGALAPLTVSDAKAATLPPALRDIGEKLGTRAMLIVPITFRKAVLALIWLHHCRRSYRWSEEEVSFVKSLALQLSIAFEYTRLYTAKEHEIQVTKTLLEITNEINTKLDFSGISPFLLEKSVALLNAERGCICFLDEAQEHLFFDHFHPVPAPGEAGQWALPIHVADNPILMDAVRKRETSFVEGLDQSLATDDRLHHLFAGSGLLLSPIMFGERMFGLLVLVWRHARPAPEFHERRLVEGICNQAAIFLERSHLSSEVTQLRRELRGAAGSEMIVGNSVEMQQCVEMALYVADKAVTVLLGGESGTGKEVLADFIRRNSSRHDKPYVKINCGALPEGILESELFGHEKGAFTDARSTHIGKFEVADGGTLFLDEVGEMSASAQVKLLRVLQDGEFNRVGGNEVLRTDVRVIAATNLDLERAIDEGRFRKDLYYRLNVYPITLPCLRERKEDLLLLINHFFEKCKRRNGKYLIGISEQALQALRHCDWPGNIRELENVIERAVIVARGNIVTVTDLPEFMQGLSVSPVQSSEDASARAPDVSLGGAVRIEAGAPLCEVEKTVILETLKHTGGDKTRAAKLLGIGRKTLYRKLEQYGHRSGKGARPWQSGGGGAIGKWETWQGGAD